VVFEGLPAGQRNSPDTPQDLVRGWTATRWSSQKPSGAVDEFIEGQDDAIVVPPRGSGSQDINSEDLLFDGNRPALAMRSPFSSERGSTQAVDVTRIGVPLPHRLKTGSFTSGEEGFPFQACGFRNPERSELSRLRSHC